MPIQIEGLDLGRIYGNVSAIQGQQQQNQLMQMQMGALEQDQQRSGEFNRLLGGVDFAGGVSGNSQALPQLYATDPDRAQSIVAALSQFDEAKARQMKQEGDLIVRAMAGVAAGVTPFEQAQQRLMQAGVQGAETLTPDQVMPLIYEHADLDTITSQVFGEAAGPASSIGKLFADIERGVIPPEMAGQAIAAALDSGKTSVTVNNAGGPQIGTIPSGYQVITDPETQAMRMEPIPGGPVEAEMASDAAKAAAAQEQRVRAGTTVVQDLQRALDMVGQTTTGVGAPALVARNIPESDAQAISGFVESALSNVGLDTLQTMRENSPTGGALGQVPIEQQKRLEQVLGSLDITQRREIVEDNIKRVINIYMDIMHGTPEQIQRLVEEGKIPPDRAADVSFRHPLSFDEFGRPVGAAEGGATGNDVPVYRIENGSLVPVE